MKTGQVSLAWSQTVMTKSKDWCRNRSKNDYSIFWAYCIVVEKRKSLIEKLAHEGIASMQIHPRNDVYSMFSMSKRHLPNLDAFAERELSLPCGWWVDEDEIGRICNVIRRGW